MLLFALAWIPVAIMNVVYDTMVQTIIPDGFLERVMALDVSVSAAAVPIKSFFGGVAAVVISIKVVVAAGLGFLALAGYWFAHRC